MAIDYATLSLAEVRVALLETGRDVEATFGSLTDVQLNWRSDPARWSIGQCFEHLFTANGMMVDAAASALDGSQPRTIWVRVPLLPRIIGPMLVRSQAPQTTRKFVAPRVVEPSASATAADIVQRFLAHNAEAIAWMQTLDQSKAAATVMTSPFVSFITYRVTDGCRLLLAHDRRHIEQARRITQLAMFQAPQRVAH